jgi:hypothetical protein
MDVSDGFSDPIDGFEITLHSWPGDSDSKPVKLFVSLNSD